MNLNKIEDPRDNLQRAHRAELVAFAQAKGQADITEEMPAEQIREVLRTRGLTQIHIRRTPIGHIGRHEIRPLHEAKQPKKQTDDAPALSADELARFRAWQAQQRGDSDAPLDVDALDMAGLRKACKAKGIRMARTDNLTSLREKLKAHG